MAKRKFLLRLEEDKMKALEKWAADEFRSTNGQLEWLITKALSESGRSKQNMDVENVSSHENNDSD